MLSISGLEACLALSNTQFLYSFKTSPHKIIVSLNAIQHRLSREVNRPPTTRQITTLALLATFVQLFPSSAYSLNTPPISSYKVLWPVVSLLSSAFRRQNIRSGVYKILWADLYTINKATKLFNKIRGRLLFYRRVLAAVQEQTEQLTSQAHFYPSQINNTFPNIWFFYDRLLIILKYSTFFLNF